jgi:tetratricopeptide (TPR) repeat protein
MHSLKIIVAALTLAYAGQTLAAGEAPSKVPGARSMAQTGSEDLLGRTVYQSLIGEFALRHGDLDLASSAWADLALRTRDPQVFARAIEVLGLAKKYDTAIELADLWLKTEPNSAKAKQAQSSLMLMTNRLDELAPQISHLLTQDPAALPLNLLQLNRLLARHADKKAVQKLVDRVVAPYLDMPEAHFTLSQAANNAGDEMRALSEAEKALQLRPDWEAAALIRAQLQARHKAETAIDGLSDFVRRYPKANDARLMLARLLISQKRFDESHRQFDLLAKEAPDNPEVIYPLAMLALQQGDAAGGRAQLEHLLNTDFPDKNTLHFFIGQIDEETQQLDTALAQYLMVAGGEQFIAARTRAALILQKQGKFDVARETISSTQGANAAERTQLLLAESQLLREVGRNDEAYALLEKNLRKQPENIELLYEAALLAERQGKPEMLEKHLKRLLEIKPEHAHALNALAYSWAERNIRLPEAEKLVARALLAAPEDAFIMDSQGWVFYRQGRLTEALQTLERAYSLKNDGEIAAHIGEVLWALERKDEARRVLREAAKRHPENEALAAVIKKLLP